MRDEEHALHRIAPFVRWCGELRLPPNYSRGQHHIFEHLFIFVVDGYAEYRVGRRSWHLSPGDLLLVPPGVVTAARTGNENPMRYRFIRFDFDFVGDYDRRPMNSLESGAGRYPKRTPPMPARLRLPRKINIRDDPRVALLFDRVILETEAKEPGYELFVRASLMELIAIVHRRRSKWKKRSPTRLEYPGPVREAVAFMEARVGDRLSLAEIARAVHLSPQHFGRLFRRATGVSPLRYLMCARLRMAKVVLQQRDATVKQAAFTAGFDDQLYFTRVFHRIEGITPSDYRRAVLSVDGAITLKAAEAHIRRLKGPFFTIPPAGR
ncbi:MAG: AraC family transcriptional regulator [Verrucomicrobia bacterium]|nr:AraC family transcriptional regulator [Verrucomicrobiota bacterium]